jgi:hypothetical protein
LHSQYRTFFLDGSLTCLKCALIILEDEWLSIVEEEWKLKSIIQNNQIPQLENFFKFIMSLLFGVSLHSLSREIVAQEILKAILSSGPMSYSSLTENLPSGLPNEKVIFKILNNIATPTLCNEFTDSNFVILKSLLDKCSPLFWALSPGLREASAEYLRDKVSGNIIPEINFADSSPCALIEYSILPHVFSSDHFIDLLVLVTENPACSICLKQLILYLMCLNLDQFAFECKFAIKTIIHNIFQKNEHQKLMGKICNFIASKLGFEMPLTKQMAENRNDLISAKRRALESITASQSQFLHKYSEEIGTTLESLSEYHERKHSFLLEGTCVICQENANSLTSPYGILTNVHDLGVRKTLTFSQIVAYIQSDKYPEYTLAKPTQGFFLSSCHHLVHLSCYTKLNSFAADRNKCPLCGAAYNWILPLLPIHEEQNFCAQEYQIYPDTFSRFLRNSVNTLALVTGIEFSENNTEIFMSKTFQYGLETLTFVNELGDLKISLTTYKIFLQLISFWLWDHLTESESNLNLNENMEKPDNTFLTMILKKHLINTQQQSFNSFQSLCHYFLWVLSIKVLNFIPDFCLGSNFKQETDVLNEDHHILPSMTHVTNFKFYENISGNVIEKWMKFFLQPYISQLNYLAFIFFSSNPASDQPDHFDIKLSILDILTLRSFSKYHENEAQLLSTLSSLEFAPICPSNMNFIQLPLRYDHLLIQSLDRVCNECNEKPLVPALCLLCGQIICSQARCCMKSGLGECNQHVKKFVILTIPGSLTV